jgi:hypothetical protein
VAASNSLVLGGTGDDAVNVGIGTESPGATLDVAGHIWQTGTGQSVFIGEGAGANDDLSANQNVFVGYQVGNANTTGSSNTAIGRIALTNNTVGYINTASGKEALYSNTEGFGNTASGSQALYSNTTGDYNTALGKGADVTTGDLTNATAIGYNAKVAASNSLVLGGTGDDAVNVGIGTSNPNRGKLDIRGSVNYNLGGSYGYLRANGGTGTSSGASDYSLYASDYIAAARFHAHSDARIKSVQGLSDSRKDLQTLLDIDITNYTMIDSVAHGNQTHKKVIAQQVKDVYPQAVSTATDVVPDIYKPAEISDGWIALSTDIAPGDRVKLITEKKAGIYEVLEINDSGFRVDLPEDGRVFVYGREVEDFHNVDYEAISMLNVSATQELEKRNAELTERVQHLEQVILQFGQLMNNDTEIRN